MALIPKMDVRLLLCVIRRCRVRIKEEAGLGAARDLSVCTSGLMMRRAGRRSGCLPDPPRRRSNQSMTSAHASVGAAATSPTTGTILMAADAIRQGAATTPQPEANMHSIEIKIHFIGRARID